MELGWQSRHCLSVWVGLERIYLKLHENKMETMVFAWNLSDFEPVTPVWLVRVCWSSPVAAPAPTAPIKVTCPSLHWYMARQLHLSGSGFMDSRTNLSINVPKNLEISQSAPACHNDQAEVYRWPSLEWAVLQILFIFTALWQRQNFLSVPSKVWLELTSMGTISRILSCWDLLLLYSSRCYRSSVQASSFFDSTSFVDEEQG